MSRESGDEKDERMKRAIGRVGFVIGMSACAALPAGQPNAQMEQARGLVKHTSGEADDDSTRLQAKDAPINEAINDSLDYKKSDRADWRRFQLTGKPGVLTVELHWDNESADLSVDVFDADGVQVGRSPPRLAGAAHLRILIEVPEPELYYVRVAAPAARDASIYTLRVKWKGGQVSGPSVTPAAARATPAANPSKIFGRILESYQEGSTWTLLLDKGSSQSLESGMSGSVLDGPDGEKLLEGATFTISQVLDGSKSRANASLAKPLGKNSRVVINLK